MFARVRVLCVLAAAVAVLAATQPVAASVDALGLLTYGSNNMTDVSGDLLINGANNTSSSSTDVQQGSILISAFAETQINGNNYGPPPQTQIAGIVALECLSAVNVGTVALPTYVYTFGPATSVADKNAIKTATTDPITHSSAFYTAMSSWNSGTLIGFYDNQTPFVYQTTNPTLTQSIASAISGTPIWQFGYTGPTNVSGQATANTGEGWVASEGPGGTNDFTTVGDGSFAISVNFSLALLKNTSGVDLGSSQTTPVLVQVYMPTGVSHTIALTGGSTVGEAFLNSPWPAADTGTTIKLDVIPEPASLVVWLGVLAIGGFAIRRRVHRS